MNSIVEGLVVSFILSHLAAGASSEATAIQGAFGTWAESNPFVSKHPLLKQMLQDAAAPVIGAVAKVLQDQADLKTAIVALAQQNYAAAAAALLAAAKGAVPSLLVAA